MPRRSSSEPSLTYPQRLWFATVLVFSLGLMVVLSGGCASNQYPDATPTRMGVAVVRITALDHDGDPVGRCTAWKLDEQRMVTAGHCCEYEQTITDGLSEDDVLIGILLGTLETKTQTVPMFTLDGPHAIPGATVTVIRKDAKHDICIIKGRMYGAPIALASRDPDVGDRVFTAGYPASTFLISEGIWSGRDTDGQGIASVAVWGGASGSPILNADGRAVGVLAAAYHNFDSLAFVAPLEWLRANVMAAR